MAVFDFASSRKAILRNIYGQKNLNKYPLKRIKEAQEELLMYKDAEFQSNHWKYPEVVRYLFNEIKNTEQRDGDVKTIFAAVQLGYRIILMNDDTQELEELHLALVEALHIWAFKYEGDIAPARNFHGDAMWKDIVEKANRLIDCINAYHGDSEQERATKEA